MSLRQVLTIYNAERQLNEDDTALLHTLRRLKDGERELLVQELSDKPQKKPGSERVYERCAQCGTTKGHRYHKDSGDDGYHEFQSPPKSTKKSPRASGMASAISNSLESSRKASAATDDDGGSSDVRCQFTRADGRSCHLLPDHNIHHLTTANEHHPFVPPAQSANGPLSASNAATSSTASSETGKGAASNVHHAGG